VDEVGLDGGDDAGGRPHGDGQVPRADERVVAGLAGGVDRAGQPVAQRVGVDVRVDGDGGVEEGGSGVLQVGCR
jgi:hypothetical protein